MFARKKQKVSDPWRVSQADRDDVERTVCNRLGLGYSELHPPHMIVAVEVASDSDAFTLVLAEEHERPSFFWVTMGSGERILACVPH